MSSTGKNEQPVNALRIIQDWLLNSPSHGIRRINRSKTNKARCFWIVTFFIFTALMCTFINSTIQKFIANPTRVHLTVRQYQEPMHFPAITFCNLNPLREEIFLDELSRKNSNLTLNEYRNLFAKYMKTFLEKKIQDSNLQTLTTGYQLNDLMIQCTFNGHRCHRNLSSFFHPNYGNCYTFHHDEHVENRRRKNSFHFWSFDDGEKSQAFKLFLEFYLFEDEYLFQLNERAAFRIFIHRKNEIPILSQTSLFAAPSVFTKLIFSYRQISFSRHCRADLTDEMKEIFPNGNGRYTQILCYKLCELRFLEYVCSCTEQVLTLFFMSVHQNQSLTMKTNRMCKTEDHCLEKRIYFDSKKFCPQCLPECELIQYTIQSSYADYPNARSAEKVQKRVEKHLEKVNYSALFSNISTNKRKELLLENLVALEIASTPYATEILSESPMYTWVDLISSIGGQTGRVTNRKRAMCFFNAVHDRIRKFPLTICFKSPSHDSENCHEII